MSRSASPAGTAPSSTWSSPPSELSSRCSAADEGGLHRPGVEHPQRCLSVLDDDLLAETVGEDLCCLEGPAQRRAHGRVDLVGQRRQPVGEGTNLGPTVGVEAGIVPTATAELLLS